MGRVADPRGSFACIPSLSVGADTTHKMLTVSGRILSRCCLRILSAETLAQSTAMDARNPITAAVFSSFRKCPTKAHLLAIGEPAPDTFFANIEVRISSMYKAAAKQRLRVAAEVGEILDFGLPWPSFDSGAITHHVDCETAVYDFAPPLQGPVGRTPQEPSPSGPLVPVLFLPGDKPDLSDPLLVCFGALALSQRTGILANTGTLIYGLGTHGFDPGGVLSKLP